MKKLNFLLLFLMISMGALAQDKKEMTDKEDHSKKEMHQQHKMMMDDPEMKRMHEKHKKEVMDPEGHSSRYAEKIAQDYKLSAEQKMQVKEAQLKRIEAQKELMEEHKREMMNDSEGKSEQMAEEMENMRKQRAKIQDDFKEDMKEILNQEQYTKWEVQHAKAWRMDEGKMKNKRSHGKKKMKTKEKESDY